MRKILNIIVYIFCIGFIAFTTFTNPYMQDIYKKNNIINKKTYEKYFDTHKFTCIDLKDSEMTRFKEEKSDSIVYVSTYGDKHFLSILTKGTSLSDKVCGIIKESDRMSKELTKSIEEENEIKLESNYFTNYNLKKEKIPYQILLVSMCVLCVFFALGIIANIVSLIRKEF